ncbi:flavin monoamine oxidase family protein [Nitrospirillum sp. BR 11163]|uniref:flavin monoamine oxidase family protein n=1 Tax=Nitrospirillum sp. BR 11163 TaxID=3104323 RepID=UPI002AFF04CE|nr:flavin monoamine oxidase family protein [Nitrospirillum sp. BR 11163]MEA1674392.1 flavin monoamine oxidase family protein [Nitrospirillum sp. BR 11163]
MPAMRNLPGAGVTRRHFLEKAALLGGSAMVMTALNAWGAGIASMASAPPALRGSGAGHKLLILGAGVAGMTAAYEMSKLGYQVTILEARAFGGGRCQTARKGFKLTELGGEEQECKFDEGLYLNHGPWRIPFCHRSTLHYTKTFGIPLEVFVNENDASYAQFDTVKGPLAGKRVRQFEVRADMRGYTSELVAKAATSGKLDTGLAKDDVELFIEYLRGEGYLESDLSYRGTEGRGYKVKPGAGIDDPGPGVPSVPYAFPDLVQSRLWRMVQSVGTFDQQHTMFQPVGGMDRIAKGFEKHVGHLIKYNAEVERIRQSDSGVTVDYLDTKTGKRATVSADYCLCTIPVSVLRTIDADFSSAYKQAMGMLSYDPVCKIGLQMKRRFWEEDDAIYGGHVYTDAPGINLISLPSSGWQSAKGVLLGYYMFGADATDMSGNTPAERAAIALEAGQRIFPQYKDSFETAFSASWHLIQYNLGGWGNWSAEARATAYPVLVKPDRRIYLAGEHISYIGGWQAGAIESAWHQIAQIHQRVAA